MKHSFYRMILLLTFGLLVCSFEGLAQVKVQWDNTLGGNGFDHLFDVIPTPDGGYLLAGSSNSPASGDKSEDSNRFYDYWIIKTDENGEKQWDKTYGGSGSDELIAVVATEDGGYLLAGNSSSNASGNKSEDRIGASDYWIVKVDQSGNKQWDKTLGGNNLDELTDVAATEDGGFLLAGSSESDASGDKSEGASIIDYWIVKVDENGNKQWDETLGGSRGDLLESIVATEDGGYLLAGSSDSPVSGDKSEGIIGASDYWIIKTDRNGKKQWDKTFGGNSNDWLESIITTPDGGYLLGGFSHSNASGDKSENSRGNSDYWIVKTDENGNKQWDKTYGGNALDYLNSITTSPDGGYLLAGYSFSTASGDKSEKKKGVEDYWIVKTDENGEKQWDKTLGGSSSEVLTSALTTADGGYLLAGISNSNASGDKSEDSKGRNDYWIIKVVEVEEEEFFIKSFALINEESDAELQEIMDGDVIDLATLSGTKFSIEAITEPSVVGSVAFRLEGPFIHGHTENYAPYSIFGDKPAGDFSGRLLPPGEYVLIATPYTRTKKEGKAGISLEISFTIINSDEIEDSQVTGFTLYDAVTDKKILDLEDGTVIHTDELAHDKLTVLMHTVPDFVGSVKVELWGPVNLTRTESTKPYTLYRNNSKDLFGEVLPAGDYHLKATPYSEANAQGEAGVPLEISFTVVGVDNSNARVAVYPVPTTGVLHINHEGAVAGAQMLLLDDRGHVLISRILSSQSVEQLDLSSFKKGAYYLKFIRQDAVQVKRVVVE